MANVATFVKKGYGQVEPNHLSAQHTGQIYAQLPAAAAIDVLQNGQFAKYDYAKNEVNFTGNGEWMLVYNEVKLYEANKTEANFALVKSDYAANVYDAAGAAMPTGATMVPRLFKTNVGDIFTTNTIIGDSSTIVKGAKLAPTAGNGILGVTEETEGMLWEVVKVYTMPDGQPGAKIMRIQ